MARPSEWGWVKKVASGLGATRDGAVAAKDWVADTRAFRFGKATTKGALIVAGLAGVGAYLAMSSSRGGRVFNDERDTQVAEIPPLLGPQDLMLQSPMLASGPAEGRGEFEFRNRVLAGRGQALEQPAASAMNPRMSAIDPDAVRDLGAANLQAV